MDIKEGFSGGKIKIMHVIRPAEGGMKEHLYSLVKYLDKEHFDLLVACPEDSVVADRIRELGIAIYPTNIVGELNPKKDIKALRELCKHLIKERPHVLHTHGAKASYVGRLAGIITKVPRMVSTVHNFVLENKMPKWKKNLFKIAEGYLAKHTNSIITVSDALKKDLIRSCAIKEDQVRTIYNGIDLKSFSSSSYEDRFEFSKEISILDNCSPLIGVVARLAPQKGVEYFIKAAKLVSVKKPQARFIIVGEGPERASLEALTKNLGLQDRVFFLGERKDVPYILSTLGVFVLPSISEGLSITTLEAMAAGCPIVATKTGGVPEIIKHNYNGLLVEPKDSEKLSRGILKLLEDEHLAKRLAVNGRQHVNNRYDLSVMIKDTSNLYIDLVRNLPLN